MLYDFDKLIDRRQVNSYKWDIGPNELPMWVADMDFDTAPQIKEALRERVDQGAYGYATIPDSYFRAYQDWWEYRHGVSLDTRQMIFTTGAVPAISSIVRHVTNPKDKVLVLSPIYNIFYNSIRNNDCHVLESPLLYKDGEYQVDWEDLESQLADEDVSLMIFCNPHNPTGKVWTREELDRIGQLCVKHGAWLLSDEVHCDLTHQGFAYQPFASLSDDILQQTISIYSASKAFNLAGLQSAVVYIPNQTLYQKVNRGLNTDEVAEPNAFAIQATEAAFSKSEVWLDELQRYLDENRRFLVNQLKEALPELSMIPAEATYLAWIDCSELTDDTRDFCAYIRQETGLVLSEGDIFGGNGRQFIRWNYACPRSLLKDGLERFTQAVTKWKNEK